MQYRKILTYLYIIVPIEIDRPQIYHFVIYEDFLDLKGQAMEIKSKGFIGSDKIPVLKLLNDQFVLLSL